MGPVEAHKAQRVRELDKESVLHSWSIQNQGNPFLVAGGEGCCLWDYDVNRQFDFPSQPHRRAIYEGVRDKVGVVGSEPFRIAVVFAPGRL